MLRQTTPFRKCQTNKEILVDAYDDRKIDLKEYEFNKIENRVDIVVGKFDEKIDYKMIDQQLENTLKNLTLKSM